MTFDKWMIWKYNKDSSHEVMLKIEVFYVIMRKSINDYIMLILLVLVINKSLISSFIRLSFVILMERWISSLLNQSVSFIIIYEDGS